MLRNVVHQRLRTVAGRVYAAQLRSFTAQRYVNRYNLNKALQELNQTLKDHDIDINELKKIATKTNGSSSEEKVLYTDDLEKSFKKLKMKDLSAVMKDDFFGSLGKGKKKLNKKKFNNVVGFIEHDINLIDKNSMLFEYLNDFQLGFNDSLKNLNNLYNNLNDFDKEKRENSNRKENRKGKGKDKKKFELDDKTNTLQDIDFCCDQFLIKTNKPFDNINWDPINKLLDNKLTDDIEIMEKFKENGETDILLDGESKSIRKKKSMPLFKLKLITDFLINESILEIERLNNFNLFELNALADLKLSERNELKKKLQLNETEIEIDKNKPKEKKQFFDNWPDLINGINSSLKDFFFKENIVFLDKPMGLIKKNLENETDNMTNPININQSFPIWCFHLQQLLIVLENVYYNIPNGWKLFIDVNKLLELLEIVKSLDQPVENLHNLQEKQILHIIKSKTIFTICNLIYLKSNNFTLDPINESEYIRTLLEFNQYHYALTLFKRSKNEIKERWWYDSGLNIYLLQNNLNGFNKLLRTYDELFNANHKIKYLTPNILILSIRKFAKISNFNNRRILICLLDRCFDMIKYMGVQNDNYQDLEQNQNWIHFQTEQEGFDYFNRLLKITHNDLIYIINSLYYNKHYELMLQFWNRLLAINTTEPGVKGINLETSKFNLIKTQIQFYENFRLIEKYLTSKQNNKIHQKKEIEKIIADYDTIEDSVIIDFLFQNIHKLVENYSNYADSAIIDSLTKKLLNFYNKSIEKTKSGSIDNKMDKDKLSLQINIIIKCYLSQNNLSSAFVILNDLEQTQTAQSHHYASFISFFTKKVRLIKTSKGQTKSEIKLKINQIENQVVSFLQKMSNLNFVVINSTILTRLLFFYLESKNYDNCFRIIDQTFEQNDRILKSNHQSSEIHSTNKLRIKLHLKENVITQKLYYAIWIVYLNYYNRVKMSHDHINSRYLNNVVVSKYSIRQILNRMINVDNILPGLKLIKIIIDTFIANNDWEAIPPIVYHFSEVYGFEFHNELTEKYLKLIRNKLISTLVERDLVMSPDSNYIDLKTKFTREIKPVNITLNKVVNNRNNNENILLRKIFNLIKQLNPYDLKFNNVKKAYRDLGIPINDDKLIEITTSDD